MSDQDNNLISAGGFQTGEPIDRSAPGLQYQRYQIGLKATGAALGVGRRTVPDPSQLFRHPPMSGAQFGRGHARSIAGEGDTDEEEEV